MMMEGMMMGGAPVMMGPGGGAIVAAPQFRGPQQISLDDLPFSSIGHKAMWQGIFDMVQREVDAFMKTQKTNPAAKHKTPRIPMPNIPDKQIEMIFDSYDMDKSGILDKEKIKALMRDIQCVTVVAMSNQKGEAMEEARKEMTMMMGPQMAAMMSGAVSQMMDFELQMVKHISMQDISEEECTQLIKDLDADKDGIISKADFLRTAKKALFDPNPPEEIMQAMEAMEAAVNSGMPVALPIDGGMMVLEPMGGPMGGGMPRLGGSAAPMIMDGGMMGGPVFMDGSLPSCVPSGAFMVDSGFGHVVLDQSGTIRAGSPFIQPGQTKQARVIGTSTAAPRCIPNAAASPARGVQRLQAST